MMAGQQIEGLLIDPKWLEEGKDLATCGVCKMVLEQPTTGCPEGHAFCRQCYVAELALSKQCPTCGHATKESRLQMCRPLEGLIGQLRIRCMHGPEEEEGGGKGGAPPRAKRARLEHAKLEPLQSMSADDLRDELGRQGMATGGERGELVARLDEKRRNDAGGEEAQSCGWRGRVCELPGHLGESCAYERVACPNAVAGCKESMLRKDAALHASETCEYRNSICSHCRNPFEARALPEHETSCPEAGLECPNAGCGVMVTRRSMGEHRGGCGREKVECPCPGCEERMARAEVIEHVEGAGAVHLRRAWRRAAELEDKVGEQGRTIVAQAQEIEKHKVALAVLEENQESVNAGVRKRAEALTRVFTWSTDSSLTGKSSPPYTFTDGVRGRCCNTKAGSDRKSWMAFSLEEGPACTFHFKSSILDKDDKVLRVVSHPGRDDFCEKPMDTAP
ncbi:hypothetical protein T484DRAFT_1960447, partial [Baffinella frigidus]